jgi:hypothetical protein
MKQKHLRLGGLAATLALAFIACDGLAPRAEDEDLAEYTADGRRLAHLTINTGGNARSLTAPLARDTINYYEVIFYDASLSKYYRVAGFKGQALELSVPHDTYDNDAGGNRAIVFAGNDPGNGDKTLLAIGKLSNPNTGVINGSVSSVTFTLKDLRTDVKAAPGTTFTIGTGAPVSPAILYDTVDYNSILVPCFFVQDGQAAATAKFNIKNLGENATASGSGPNTYASFVIATGTPKLTSWGLVSSDNSHEAAPVDIMSITSPATGNQVSTVGLDGVIEFQFETPNKVGWGFINFDLPVNALATGVPGGTVWHIRGGLKNYHADAGAAVNSLGGGIVLGIGSPDTLSVTLTGP